MAENVGRPWWKGKYSFRALNGMFVLLLAVGVFSLLLDLGEAPDLDRIAAAAEATRPVLAAVLLVPMIAIFAMLFSIGSKLDRRCSEDYAFQMMSAAALAALPTVLFAHLGWEILAKLEAGPPLPTGDNVISLIMIAWPTAWFTFRVRGLQ